MFPVSSLGRLCFSVHSVSCDLFLDNLDCFILPPAQCKKHHMPPVLGMRAQSLRIDELDSLLPQKEAAEILIFPFSENLVPFLQMGPSIHQFMYMSISAFWFLWKTLLWSFTCKILCRPVFLPFDYIAKGETSSFYGNCLIFPGTADCFPKSLPYFNIPVISVWRFQFPYIFVNTCCYLSFRL